MEHNIIEVQDNLMDKDYLFDHQLMIHDYESFAKALLFEVLEIAKESVLSEPKEKITFSLEVRVEKWGNKPCNKVKIGSNWIQIR